MRVGFPGLTYAKFAAVTAGAEGRIAISYIGTTVAGGLRATPEAMADARWDAFASLSLDALDAQPVFATTRISNDPVRRGPCARRCMIADGLGTGMFDYRVSGLHPITGDYWTTITDLCTGACALTSGTAASATANRGSVGVQVAGTRIRG